MDRHALSNRARLDLMMMSISRTREGSRKTLLVTLGAIAISGICAFLWSASFQSAALGDPDDVEQVKRGWRVYGEACARCHGEDLNGEFGSATAEMAEMVGELRSEGATDVAVVAPAHNASGHTWRHSDQTLFEIIKFGKASNAEATDRNRMPAFKDELDDEDIWMTIALIKSSWPPEVLKMRKHQTH